MNEVVEDPSAYVTLHDACRIANRRYATVERWLTLGVYDLPALDCLKVSNVPLIKRSDLEQYVEQVKHRADGRTKRHRVDYTLQECC